jgi:hypothetical protein
MHLIVGQCSNDDRALVYKIDYCVDIFKFLSFDGKESQLDNHLYKLVLCVTCGWTYLVLD